MPIAPFGVQDNNPGTPAAAAYVEAIIQYLGAYTDTQVTAAVTAVQTKAITLAIALSA